MMTVDLVTRCMKRREFLELVLPTWLAVDHFNQIVIVDWGGYEHLPELLKTFPDNRLVILQVPRMRFFDGGTSRNVGVRYSSADFVFLVDCDMQIVDVYSVNGLIKKVSLNKFPNTFLFHNQYAPCPCRGTMLFSKEAYNTVNGFVENLPGWGNQDRKFVRAITKAFPNSLRINESWFSHIRHSDYLRNCNFEHNSLDRQLTNKINVHLQKTIDILHQRRKRCHCIEYTLKGRKEMIV